MALCDFGCGQLAIHQFKGSKKWCCSINANSCIGKRQRDSEKKKGINPFIGREHPRGMTGKVPHNKGKTYDETYGEERAKILKKNSSIRNMGVSKGIKQSDTFKINRSIEMKNRYANGWECVAGRCKKYKYSSNIAGNISVDGMWELAVCFYLDFLGLTWKRNNIRFDYIRLDGKNATYLPDFWVNEWNTFIEVKGYETDLDKAKWSQFPKDKNLKILRRKEINDIKKILKDNHIEVKNT